MRALSGVVGDTVRTDLCEMGMVTQNLVGHKNEATLQARLLLYNFKTSIPSSLPIYRYCPPSVEEC